MIPILGIAALLVVIIKLLATAAADETKNMGTMLAVVGLLGVIAWLVYRVIDGPLLPFALLLLLVMAWLTALIIDGSLLIKGGLLVAIGWLAYTLIGVPGLLILMLLLAVGRLIFIVFADPNRQIYEDAETEVFNHSARFIDHVRITVRR